MFVHSWGHGPNCPETGASKHTLDPSSREAENITYIKEIQVLNTQEYSRGGSDHITSAGGEDSHNDNDNE